MIFQNLSQGKGWLVLVAALFAFGSECIQAETSVSPANKQFVGAWNFLDNSGWRSVVNLLPDGTVRDGDRRFGTWTASLDYLDIHFDDHSDWLDRYNLPMSEDILKGRHNGGDLRKMARRSASAPAATAESLTGTWEYLHHDNGHRATVVFTPEGLLTENGKPFAYWVIENNRLYYSYIDHHDWVDAYALPQINGVLTSSDHKITLTKQKAIVASTGGSAASTKPATPTPPSRGGTAGVPGYFGTRNPGDLPGSGAATKPLPPLATPASTVAPVGNYATGSVPVNRVAPTAITKPASTPVAATPTPAALTPVGKWRWHSGGERTITDKGAVLDGAKVVGQWKWQDKGKGQISVQFIGGPYKAPTVYTLSGNGDHLTGMSPTSGNEHTEDRAE